MNGDFVKWLIQQFPNFAGLIALVVILIIGFSRLVSRYDRQADLLYSCLINSGVVP
jgi:hypothetical protein